MFWRKKKADAKAVEPTMGDASDSSSFDSQPDSAANEQFTVTFSFGGQKFAAGLSWSSLEGRERDAAIKAGGSHSYYFGSTTDAAQGTLGLGERSAERAIAAGVLIGALHKNALIHAKLPGSDLTWVCLISDGLPSPGFDRVFTDASEASGWYSEAYTYMDSAGCVRIGSASSDNSTLEAALEAAVAHVSGSDASPKARNAALAAYRLKAKHFDWLRFALALVAVLVILGLAVAGYMYREQLSSREKARALLEQSMRTRQAQEAEEARLRVLREAFERDVAKEKGKFGRSNVAFSQWSACEAFRRVLPISRYGYVPQKLECDFAAGKAFIHWMPSGPTVRLADRAALPGITDKYEPGNPAISQFDLAGQAEGSPSVALNPAAVRMAILDWGGVRMRSLRLSPTTDVVLSPPKDIGGEGGLKPQRLGGKAEVSFNANGALEILMSGQAVKMLDSFAVGLTKVEWRDPSAASISVSVTGILYLPN